MTNTSRLIILTGFLAGSAFGYFDFFPGFTQVPGPGDFQNQPSTQTGGRSSGFKLVRDSLSGELPLPSDTGINHLLLRYADFSPSETKAELTRLLTEFKDEKKRNAGLYHAISYLAYKLGSQSPEEAKQLLADKTSPVYEDFLTNVLEGWAEKDFQGAMSYLLSRKKELNGSIYTFTLLANQLAAKDPDRAIQWLSSLAPGERTTALHAMANEFPQSHPEKMGAYLATLTDKDMKSYPIREMASAWAETDWNAAYAWAGTLKGYKKQEALSHVIAGLGKTDLPKATEELKKANKQDRDSIGSAIIDSSFDDNDRTKGKALDWVLANKDHFSSPESAVQSCLYRHDAQSPEVTRKVLQMPEGALKDSALQTMIQTRSNMASSGYDYTGGPTESNTPFQDVLNLADNIRDTETQNRAVNDCLRTWIRKSPEEAREWITKNSKLPDQEKQNLLQACDSRKKEGTEQ